MSAPRKIWVPVPVTDEGPCYVDKDEAEMQWGCTAVAYHHDDVVRELVVAADRLVNNPGWGTVNYTDDGMWADGEALRAALAKIAQHDS